jgi:hypothetical protein
MKRTSINKIISCVATGIATAMCLFLAFGAIAVLDEFARLPFYQTVPIGAIMINVGVLFLFYRARSGIRIFDHLRSKLQSIKFELPSRKLSFYPRAPVDRAATGDQRENGQVHPPLPQEIKSALQGIHSIAWGFPTANRTIKSFREEEHIRDEARQ